MNPSSISSATQTPFRNIADRITAACLPLAKFRVTEVLPENLRDVIDYMRKDPARSDAAEAVVCDRIWEEHSAGERRETFQYLGLVSEARYIGLVAADVSEIEPIIDQVIIPVDVNDRNGLRYVVEALASKSCAGGALGDISVSAMAWDTITAKHSWRFFGIDEDCESRKIVPRSSMLWQWNPEIDTFQIMASAPEPESRHPEPCYAEPASTPAENTLDADPDAAGQAVMKCVSDQAIFDSQARAIDPLLAARTLIRTANDATWSSFDTQNRETYFVELLSVAGSTIAGLAIALDPGKIEAAKLIGNNLSKKSHSLTVTETQKIAETLLDLDLPFSHRYFSLAYLYLYALNFCAEAIEQDPESIRAATVHRTICNGVPKEKIPEFVDHFLSCLFPAMVDDNAKKVVLVEAIALLSAGFNLDSNDQNFIRIYETAFKKVILRCLRMESKVKVALIYAELENFYQDFTGLDLVCLETALPSSELVLAALQGWTLADAPLAYAISNLCSESFNAMPERNVWLFERLVVSACARLGEDHAAIDRMKSAFLVFPEKVQVNVMQYLFLNASNDLVFSALLDGLVYTRPEAGLESVEKIRLVLLHTANGATVPYHAERLISIFLPLLKRDPENYDPYRCKILSILIAYPPEQIVPKFLDSRKKLLFKDPGRKVTREIDQLNAYLAQGIMFLPEASREAAFREIEKLATGDGQTPIMDLRLAEAAIDSFNQESIGEVFFRKYLNKVKGRKIFKVYRWFIEQTLGNYLPIETVFEAIPSSESDSEFIDSWSVSQRHGLNPNDSYLTLHQRNYNYVNNYIAGDSRSVELFAELLGSLDEERLAAFLARLSAAASDEHWLCQGYSSVLDGLNSPQISASAAKTFIRFLVAHLPGLEQTKNLAKSLAASLVGMPSNQIRECLRELRAATASRHDAFLTDVLVEFTGQVMPEKNRYIQSLKCRIAFDTAKPDLLIPLLN